MCLAPCPAECPGAFHLFFKTPALKKHRGELVLIPQDLHFGQHKRAVAAWCPVASRSHRLVLLINLTCRTLFRFEVQDLVTVFVHVRSKWLVLDGNAAARLRTTFRRGTLELELTGMPADNHFNRLV